MWTRLSRACATGLRTKATSRVPGMRKSPTYCPVLAGTGRPPCAEPKLQRRILPLRSRPPRQISPQSLCAQCWSNDNSKASCLSGVEGTKRVAFELPITHPTIGMRIKGTSYENRVLYRRFRSRIGETERSRPRRKVALKVLSSVARRVTTRDIMGYWVQRRLPCRTPQGAQTCAGTRSRRRYNG